VELAAADALIAAGRRLAWWLVLICTDVFEVSNSVFADCAFPNGLTFFIVSQLECAAELPRLGDVSMRIEALALVQIAESASVRLNAIAKFHVDFVFVFVVMILSVGVHLGLGIVCEPELAFRILPADVCMDAIFMMIFVTVFLVAIIVHFFIRVVLLDVAELAQNRIRL
jgi:hypothetical protein